ncbi:hypothetical protein MCAMS1_01567 [biofilm metagenome]
MPILFEAKSSRNLQVVQWVVYLLAVICLATAGCSLESLREKLKATTGDDKESIGLAADRLTELDQATYSYSDRFVTIISDAADRAVKANPSKEAKKEALRLKLHNSSSVYAIASGPNPLGQLLDLATVATLNKIQMVDEGRAKQIFGDNHNIIETAFYAVHDDIWGVARRFLQPSEISSIQRVIAQWRKNNPNVTMLAYVRFDDFARANAGLKQNSPEIGGLFDEINKVNQTVETAQQFGERTFFYFQRYPRLLQWQTERTVEGVMDNAGLQQLQNSVQTMAKAANIFAQEIQKLKDREAAIQKHLETVSIIVDQVHKLMPNTQAVVQDSQKLMIAAKDTSIALGDTLKVVDTVSAKFKSDKPEPPGAKPFDINEYQRTAEEVTKVVGEVNVLMNNLQGEDLGKRTTELQKLVDAEIDHLTWRIVQLVILLFVLALVYRFISMRMGKGIASP